MWCGSCKEAWNWRDREAEDGRVERVKCNMCRGKDAVVGGKVERNYHKRSLTEFVIEEFWFLKQGRISNKRCC